ncbi:MAG: bifunctional DNA-formamidopyrimidine glycosylase/DNA-(apurinic or apyrimidinic site) lyase [Phycisphaeraceae bacterium]
MPELPEVERVRDTLGARLPGRKVRAVRFRRREVVRGGSRPSDLLAGDRIERVDRLGKQLAIVGASGRCVCVHLGMTGSLRWERKGAKGSRGRGAKGAEGEIHVHLTWTLDDGSTLRFRDPRRFGGVWTFGSVAALHERRWAVLGPDALRVRPGELHRRLQGTRRGLKAALLDQRLVAGLGNIYVDELLFMCGFPPTRPADTLGADEVRGLVRRMRSLLRRAIAAGGSTFRDYAGANGEKGRFQHRHRVYGRGGEPCTRCGAVLAEVTVAGRTTVFCTCCQPGEHGPATVAVPGAADG